MRRPGSTSLPRSAVPVAVWALCALHLALLALFSVLYPPYLGPDEPQHVDMVVALRAGDGWQAPGERDLSLGVFTTSDPIYPEGDVEALPRPYLPAEFAPRGERLSLEQAGGNAPSTGVLPNQMVQHPPLYYASGALLLELVPGADGLPYDRQLGVLRLLSALLVAPLPLLCWAAARLLRPEPALALAAAAAPLAVPGLTRIGAMAGNDSLMMLAGAAATVALLRVARGDVTLRTAGAAGALVTLALLAKGFGLVFLPLLVVAYGLAAWRVRSWAVVRAAVLAGAVAGLGALWWLRNLVLYGVVQPRGFGNEATAALLGEPRAADTPLPVLPFVEGFAALVTTRAWAGLGVVEPPTFPVALAAGLTLLLLLLVVVALVQGVRDRTAVDQLLLLGPVVLVLGLTVASAWSAYATYGRDPGVQGRYLYVGAVGVAVVAAVGLHRVVGRWAPLVVLLAVVALQGYAVALVGDDFWLVDGGGPASAVAGIRYVSPWPTPVTALIAASVPVAAGATAWSAQAVVRQARARRQVEAG